MGINFGEKAVVDIAGKQYELKFTIGFWRRIKEACGVTYETLETCLREDFGNVASQIIINSVVGDEKPKLEDIEDCCDYSVIDVFEQAMINCSTKAQLEYLEVVKNERANLLETFGKSGEEGVSREKK